IQSQPLFPSMSSPQDENIQIIEPAGRIMRGFSRLGIFGLAITFFLNFLLEFSYPAFFALIAFAASAAFPWIICYAHSEPSIRWRFFGTALGKKICWYFYILCILNLLRYLNSIIPIIFAIISSSSLLAFFLINHFGALKQLFHDILSSQLSLAG